MIDAARRAGWSSRCSRTGAGIPDYLTLRRCSTRASGPAVRDRVRGDQLRAPGYRNPTSDRPRGWRTYAEFGAGRCGTGGLFDQAVQIAGPAPLSVFADVQYRRDWDVETAGMAWLRYPPAGGGPEGEGPEGEGLRYGIETGSISALPKPRWFVRGSEGAYLQYGRDPQGRRCTGGRWGPG